MIEYKINLGGTSCAVVEWNPEAKTTVFALHGWLDNLASFETLIQFMPDIRLIAIDFPGHGHSEHIPPDYSYHFIDGLYLVDDLVAYFEQEKINLLGHSMGGAVATLYATAQSSRVRKLALIESLGPLTVSPESGSDLMRKSMNQRAELKSKNKPIYNSFAKALAARAYVSEIDESLIKPIVERGLEKVEQGYTWRADSRLRIASPIRMSESQLLVALEEINCEVLYLEGDKGYLVDQALFSQRKRKFSNLAEKLLEGGHHVHLEQPAICAGHIQAFFNKTD